MTEKLISQKNKLNKSKSGKNLCAYTIPLFGKHLIEASAGTGKTYNITRIYLRLILERRLTVQQILVMTFTKDATEELRGRIDASIREAINHWSQLVEKDDYFRALAATIDQAKAISLLKMALLYLDEAAIFTIHGFCKRVLSQHAFETGMTFNVQMESNCQNLVLEACQDWYRCLAKNSPEKFQLIAQFWSSPEIFLSQFAQALKANIVLGSLTKEQVEANFLDKVRLAQNSLVTHQTTLFSSLVDTKKGAAKQQRIEEYQQLLTWLAAVLAEVNHVDLPMPTRFINGNRFSRRSNKAELVNIFQPVNELKVAKEKIIEQLQKAQAYTIVSSGIAYISDAIAAKKQQLNSLSFDDLISTLANVLLNTENRNKGQQFAQRLFEQYPAALVDEFQDTDPQQFAILQAIYYPQIKSALYLIGDPKQAVYGFRGGDVFAYLSARNHCDQQWVMDTNWRSSTQMITAYNRLFWGNDLSLPAQDVFGYGITYSQVKASVKAIGSQSITSTSLAASKNALQFVYFKAHVEDNGKAKARLQSFRPIMALWCAQEISRLLATQQIRAKDIAILVRDGTEAREIKSALIQFGLSTVYLSDHEKLLKTKQASQLLSILKGILFVENERLYSAALASPLMGIPPRKFHQLQQEQVAWQTLKLTFIQLRTQWQNKSFISMALNLLHQHFVLDINTIGEGEQDRVLTNLIHLFELLQSASQRHQQPQELLYWYELQLNLDSSEGEAELRLESDEDLIKIVTQHGSKGLEYPVVFIPFATRHKDPLKFANKTVSLIKYHDEKGQLNLSLDGSATAKATMAAEAYAETVRLLYVAITRAEQRCYLLVADFANAFNSPLGRTLQWQKGEPILQNLQQLTLKNNETIALTIVNDGESNDEENNTFAQTDSVKQHSTELNKDASKIAIFTSKIERDWWLSSFSSLSKNLAHSYVSKPDRDRQAENTKSMSDNSSELMRFTLVKGAQAGNLLHDILEHTDFAQPNWSKILAKPLQHFGFLMPEDLITTEAQQLALSTWLDEILLTPLLLTPAEQEKTVKNTVLTLASLTMKQTLREVEFYFPIKKIKTSQLADLLSVHRQTYRQAYQQKETIKQVHLPSFQHLHGMMHGFIDLIFEHQGKYYLCDYKSTHLGHDFQDYHVDKLAKNIEENYYDLQYLIYALALHRYLKQRLVNYKVNEHFGGIFYLYLRGMSNTKNQPQNGVFYRQLTEAELINLDQLFSGEQKTTLEPVEMLMSELKNDE